MTFEPWLRRHPLLAYCAAVYGIRWGGMLWAVAAVAAVVAVVAVVALVKAGFAHRGSRRATQRPVTAEELRGSR